jgi:hypothetical protein
VSGSALLVSPYAFFKLLNHRHQALMLGNTHQFLESTIHFLLMKAFHREYQIELSTAFVRFARAASTSDSAMSNIVTL